MSRWTCGVCEREFARPHQVLKSESKLAEVRPRGRSLSLLLTD